MRAPCANGCEWRIGRQLWAGPKFAIRNVSDGVYIEPGSDQVRTRFQLTGCQLLDERDGSASSGAGTVPSVTSAFLMSALGALRFGPWIAGGGHTDASLAPAMAEIAVRAAQKASTQLE